jgi:hypothetical protein
MQPVEDVWGSPFAEPIRPVADPSESASGGRDDDDARDGTTRAARAVGEGGYSVVDETSASSAAAAQDEATWRALLEETQRLRADHARYFRSALTMACLVVALLLLPTGWSSSSSPSYRRR